MVYVYKCCYCTTNNINYFYYICGADGEAEITKNNRTSKSIFCSDKQLYRRSSINTFTQNCTQHKMCTHTHTHTEIHTHTEKHTQRNTHTPLSTESSAYTTMSASWPRTVPMVAALVPLSAMRWMAEVSPRLLLNRMYLHHLTNLSLHLLLQMLSCQYLSWPAPPNQYFRVKEVILPTYCKYLCN